MSSKPFRLHHKVRRFHKIPIHLPLNHLSAEEIARLKEEYHKALPKIREQLSKDGFLVEDKFIKAWSDRKFFPKWIKSVRKATFEEDHHGKTDAVIICTDCREIRIQIKLRRRIHSELILSLYRKGVVALSVQPFEKPRVIRRKTLEAISRFDEWKSKQSK